MRLAAQLMFLYACVTYTFAIVGMELFTVRSWLTDVPPKYTALWC